MSPFDHACACNSDGYSGSVLTTAVGCEYHGYSDVWCYVATPPACYFAAASVAHPGAAWINCDLSTGLPAHPDEAEAAGAALHASSGCTDACMFASDGEAG